MHSNPSGLLHLVILHSHTHIHSPPLTAGFPVAAVRAGAGVSEPYPACAGPSMILRPRFEQTPCASVPSASAGSGNEA